MMQKIFPGKLLCCPLVDMAVSFSTESSTLFISFSSHFWHVFVVCNDVFVEENCTFDIIKRMQEWILSLSLKIQFTNYCNYGINCRIYVDKKKTGYSINTYLLFMLWYSFRFILILCISPSRSQVYLFATRGRHVCGYFSQILKNY